jgi:hypothetical protein
MAYLVGPRCLDQSSGITLASRDALLVGPFLLEESGIGLGNVGSRSPKPTPNPRPSAGEFP